MKTKRIIIKGKPSIGLWYDDSDFLKMKKIYKDWKGLNEILEELESRALNVPDVLSEGLFCYLFKVYRVNGKANSLSYDAYDPKDDIGIQIKSCSIDDDCTSFGPETVWDRIYFMKFYPKSEDGRVEIYDITDYKFDNLILNKKRNETFKMQQEQGRRPRFSINSQIIKKYDLQPIKTVFLLK